MIRLSYFLQAVLSAMVYAVVYSGWRAYLRARSDHAAYRADFLALLAATLGWTQVFVVIILLGFTKVLYASYVLGINAAITFFLLGSMRAGGMRACVAGAAAVRERMRKLGAPGVLLLAFAAVATGWFAALNILLPVGGYDDFVYHIPGAAFFLQEHSIGVFDVAPVQDGINSAPKLGEMFSLWQFVITGNDRLVNLWSIGFFLQYLLAVYGLCREFGATRRVAAFSSILSSLAPVFMCQMITSYNDLPMCAMFATAARFVVARARGGLQRAAVAMSCGLLLSSKLSAPLLAGVVFALFAFSELLSEDPPGWTRIARRVTAMSAIALALGGAWYVRNAIVYGNPFFPYASKLAGLRGPVSHEHELEILNRELARVPLPQRLWSLWREERSHFGLWLYNYDSAYAGLGPVFFVLGLPSLVAGCVFSGRARAWLNCATLLLIAGSYLGFGGNISPRLSLFILPGIGLGVATTLTAIGGKPWSFDPFRKSMAVAVWVVGTLLGVYTFLVTAMSPIAAATLRSQFFTVPRDKDHIDGTFLNAFAAVRDAIPRGSVVVYDESTTFLWPLWRADWSNDVRFVSSNSGEWSRWRERAAAVGATHVVVGRPEGGRLGGWIRENVGRFRLIAAGGFGELYEYSR